MQQLPSGKTGLTPRQRFNRKRLASLLITLLVLTALFLISPSTRPLLSHVQLRWNLFSNQEHLYQSTAYSINKALIGTRYSAMHNAPAGITVIFNVSANEANLLRNPAFNFSSSSTFQIANNPYKDIRQLENSYAISLPRNRVAAVISRTEITSLDCLKALLEGLQVSQLGPDQNAGAFLIYGEDQQLIRRLQKQGVILGRLQTTQPPDKSSSARVVVPLDKRQKMDVALGRRR